MDPLLSDAKGRWKRLKATSGFHSAAIFLACVLTAALFWYILALNDNMQDGFFVKININDVPKNVTFISDVPDRVYVTIRDKGTSLMRHGRLKDPSIDIDFRRYAANGVLRYRRADMMAALRNTFGTNATVSSISIDSIRLDYTTNPGKRIPVVIDGDVGAASGFVIAGRLISDPVSVVAYSTPENLDTLHKAHTVHFERLGLSESTKMEVRIRPMAGIRTIPDEVQVRIPVETLVHKVVSVSVEPVNVPAGKGLLLFPSKVNVGFYVPMNRFNEDETDIEVYVDYEDIERLRTKRIPVRIAKHPESLVNVSVVNDSVEYTIVKD